MNDPFKILILIFLYVSLTGCSPSVPEYDVEPKPKQPRESELNRVPKSANEIRTEVSTETPNNLSSIWDSLPLIPTPEPLTTSIPQKPDKAVRYFPEAEPDGNVQLIENAVWQAGYLNGLPADVDSSFSVGEYASERDFASAIHINQPNELPPFLEAGQVLVIHVPELPPDVYVLHVATTGGNKEEGGSLGFYQLETYHRRFMILRLNDVKIWQKTLPPFHSISRAVLNPNNLRIDGNLVTIENTGMSRFLLKSVVASGQCYQSCCDVVNFMS
ncbi:hypothetical protein P0Y35_18685 [Kiritimatiellaeota bacterium B1221]|nr:hypothetical protein [Kiritimatiellaeota bacterium B1221]